MGTEATCEICGDEILAGEKVTDDGSEIAHTACVKHWFAANFGAETLH